MNDPPLFESSLFSRKVVGDYAVYDQSLLFRAGTFPDRTVNGKPLVVTSDHLSRIVKSFSAPIGANIQHTNFLKGQAAHVMSVWQDGNELRGSVAIPLWLDENIDDSHRKVSVELNPQTFDSLVGLALCTNPAITDAQLMTAQADYFTKAKTKHTTYHGQSSMQHLHDQAARSGAICKDTEVDDKGKMTSKNEAKGFQAIHDMALDHGASCSSMGYGYYTDSTSPLDMPHSDTTLTSETLIPPVPTNTPPTNTKDRKPMKLSDLVALFTGKSTAIENDLDSVVMDPSGVVHKVEPLVGEPLKIDVTKSAEFIAKDQEAKDLAEQLAKFQTAADAEFTRTNEAAIDALIAAGKYDPKHRDTLLVDRKSAPVLFDKMAELLPVASEFKSTAQPTIPADQASDIIDQKNTATTSAGTATYLANAGVGLRL